MHSWNCFGTKKQQILSGANISTEEGLGKKGKKVLQKVKQCKRGVIGTKPQCAKNESGDLPL